MTKYPRQPSQPIWWCWWTRLHWGERQSSRKAILLYASNSSALALSLTNFIGVNHPEKAVTRWAAVQLFLDLAQVQAQMQVPTWVVCVQGPPHVSSTHCPLGVIQMNTMVQQKEHEHLSFLSLISEPDPLTPTLVCTVFLHILKQTDVFRVFCMQIWGNLTGSV